MRTWEFKVNNMGPVRSVAGMSPFVHIPVVIYKWIADRISSRSANTHYSGSDLINRVLLPSRLATALGSLFIDMFILSSCMHIHHSRTLKLTRVQHFLSFIRYNSVPTASLLYASCAFGGILLSTRTIVNTWESIYVSVFGLLFFEILNHIKRSDVLQGKQYFITILICIQSSLIVWASFLRPTYLLFILPIGIIELVFLVAKFKIIFIATRLPIIVFVILCNTFVCVLIDTLYFHNTSVSNIFHLGISKYPLICTPCRFFAYNSNTQHVSSHGLHPRFTHFLVNWPLILGPIFVLRLFTQPLQSRSLTLCVAWVSVVFPTLILSLIPHQEARFLIPCLPYACFVIGQSIDGKARFTRRFSCLCIISSILWIIHQSALIIFYGYLHQAGILSYMRTISIDVNDCVTHVFFRTYMPPRFPLGIPLTKSSNDVIQSCISLIDLSGSSVSVLNTTLNNLKANQNSTGIIKLVFPGSLLTLTDFLPSSWSDTVASEQFFPHLSMEYPPSIQPFTDGFHRNQNYHSVNEYLKSQLSLHVLTFKV
uniref:Mannosyltransferase n=1 Tax=Trichobilharzia regenti TaxID=157069 RepID=A0AA85K5R2_TRIRE|nr:unnamed protein product [Trichobilharzia regenti]